MGVSSNMSVGNSIWKTMNKCPFHVCLGSIKQQEIVEKVGPHVAA